MLKREWVYIEDSPEQILIAQGKECLALVVLDKFLSTSFAAFIACLWLDLELRANHAHLVATQRKMQWNITALLLVIRDWLIADVDSFSLTPLMIWWNDRCFARSQKSSHWEIAIAAENETGKSCQTFFYQRDIKICSCETSIKTHSLLGTLMSRWLGAKILCEFYFSQLQHRFFVYEIKGMRIGWNGTKTRSLLNLHTLD